MSECRFLIITYGTAWAYENLSTGNVVANCHKMPTKNFNRLLLTQKKIIESFDTFYTELKTINPTCKVVLSVSPVRHVRDTLELNSVSKSILRLTCHTLSESYHDVAYFPAYEIMLDDLRDYRFYKEDMIHPSIQAVDYIWEKFGEVFFASETLIFLDQWKKIQTALEHKPFHANSEQHQKFLHVILAKLNELSDKIDLTTEIGRVKIQLAAGSQ